MAERLNDKKKKKLIADYLELESYNAVARKNNVSKDTVRRVLKEYADFVQKAQDKKRDNTDDILSYMESKKNVVCEIIGKGLDVLSSREKLEGATPSQITTAIGTLIDKWSGITGTNKGKVEIVDDI